MYLRRMTKLFALAALALVSVAAAQDLTGAGATFPYPLYSKMFDAYSQEKDVQVNYQSIGSGGGQQQLLNKTVNFAASDAPLDDDQLQRFQSTDGSPVLHFPMALGAVVIAYNWAPIAEAPATPLVLDGDTIARIFLGEIASWDDEAIKALNPDIALPSLPISVAHRSDGSGTTYTFTEYLAKANGDWAERVGTGKAVEWPTGSGGKGNEGVAGLIEQIPGSIGYVELAYAKQNDLSYASIENASGNVVAPTLASTSAAGAVSVPPDGRFSITDSAAPQGYPIATYTYILLFQDMAVTTDSVEQAKQVRDLVLWMSHEGQQYSEPLEYGALPDNVRQFDADQLDRLTYDGKPLNGS